MTGDPTTVFTISDESAAAAVRFKKRLSALESIGEIGPWRVAAEDSMKAGVIRIQFRNIADAKMAIRTMWRADHSLIAKAANEAS